MRERGEFCDRGFLIDVIPCVADGGRLWSDRHLDSLERVCCVIVDLDELRARRAEWMLVVEWPRFRINDFVARKAGGVWQLIHPFNICARHACRRGERELPADAPQVTMPASAPVWRAITLLAAACRSSISTKAQLACRIASRIDSLGQLPADARGVANAIAEAARFHNDQTRDLGAYLCGRRLYEVMTYWDTVEDDPASPEVELDFARIWKALPKIVFSTTLESVDGNARWPRAASPRRSRSSASSPGRTSQSAAPARPAECARLGLIDEYRVFVSPGRDRWRHAVLSSPGRADRPRARRDADVQLAGRVPALPARMRR